VNYTVNNVLHDNTKEKQSYILVKTKNSSCAFKELFILVVNLGEKVIF
jgi:hypothetical protein